MLSTRELTGMQESMALYSILDRQKNGDKPIQSESDFEMKFNGWVHWSNSVIPSAEDLKWLIEAFRAVYNTPLFFLEEINPKYKMMERSNPPEQFLEIFEEND